MMLTEPFNLDRMLDMFLLGLQAGVLIVCVIYMGDMLA